MSQPAWERPKPGGKNARSEEDKSLMGWSLLQFVKTSLLAWVSRGAADRNRIPVTDATGKLDVSFLPATVVLDTEYTAADVLDKVKTVDGAGSGLDADTLDGVQGANYARTDVAETFDSNVTITGLLLSQKMAAKAATSLADDATATLTTAGRGLIWICSISGNRHFLGFFSSGGVVEISDPTGTWAQADTDGSNCIYWSSGLILKNRFGSSQSYYYHIWGDVNITA